MALFKRASGLACVRTGSYGIGGLAAALSLLQAGFDVHVYEQVRAPREIGAGIVLTPNATRLLYRLGLQGKLETVGVAPLAWRQRRWDDGRTLMSTSVAVSPGAPAMFYTSHRADVLSMLIEALPSARLHLGHRLTAFTDQGNRVQIQFGNGALIEADIGYQRFVEVNWSFMRRLVRACAVGMSAKGQKRTTTWRIASCTKIPSSSCMCWHR